MRITEVFPFKDLMNVMVDSDGNKLGEGREPGRHVSEIIHHLRLVRGAKTGPEDEMPGLRMFAGFMWEVALEWAFKLLMGLREGVAKQPKCQLRHIHMSPDGLDVEDPAEFVLEEYKLTWRSMRWMSAFKPRGKWIDLTFEEAFEENFFDWSLQIPAYLKCLSESLGRPVRKARLYVFFVMGDYSFERKRGPQIRVFELEYTDEELEQNWTVLLNAEEGMEKKEVA
jgi:hypothetical protein